MKTVRFGFSGQRIHPYHCSEPGGNTGEYVPAEVARELVAACEAALPMLLDTHDVAVQIRAALAAARACPLTQSQGE